MSGGDGQDGKSGVVRVTFDVTPGEEYRVQVGKGGHGAGAVHAPQGASRVAVMGYGGGGGGGAAGPIVEREPPTKFEAPDLPPVRARLEWLTKRLLELGVDSIVTTWDTHPQDTRVDVVPPMLMHRDGDLTPVWERVCVQVFGDFAALIVALLMQVDRVHQPAPHELFETFITEHTLPELDTVWRLGGARALQEYLDADYRKAAAIYCTGAMVNLIGPR